MCSGRFFTDRFRFGDTYRRRRKIPDALDQGCETFLIGIGGSATNDGGIGMLKALGFRFPDDHEQDVGEGAQALGKICRIETKDADPRLSRCRFRIACDVVNPLCGPEGATCIFGAQKGLAECQMTVVDIEAFFSILRNICTLEQAMESNQARRNLADTAEQVPHCDGTVEDFPIPVYGEREMVISVSFQRIIKGVE